MRKKKKFNISLLAYVLCAIMIIIIIPCVSDISGDVFRSKGRMSGYEEDSLDNDFIENNYEGLLEKTEYNTGMIKIRRTTIHLPLHIKKLLITGCM